MHIYIYLYIYTHTYGLRELPMEFGAQGLGILVSEVTKPLQPMADTLMTGIGVGVHLRNFSIETTLL